jgi:hypothetical protein
MRQLSITQFARQLQEDFHRSHQDLRELRDLITQTKWIPKTRRDSRTAGDRGELHVDLASADGLPVREGLEFLT